MKSAAASIIRWLTSLQPIPNRTARELGRQLRRPEMTATTAELPIAAVPLSSQPDPKATTGRQMRCTPSDRQPLHVLGADHLALQVCRPDVATPKLSIVFPRTDPSR
jgi:hypothetical protein